MKRFSLHLESGNLQATNSSECENDCEVDSKSSVAVKIDFRCSFAAQHHEVMLRNLLNFSSSYARMNFHARMM
jgi:hypothetical protein